MVNIILASASPRRKEILDKFNFKYHVMKSDILEKTNPLDGPYDTAMSLAFEKAYYIGKNYENHIIIGADTSH